MALYYDPRVHDFGTPAIRGAMQGVSLGMSIQGGIAASKRDKAEAEVGQLENEYYESMKGNQEKYAALDQKSSEPPVELSPEAQKLMGEWGQNEYKANLIDYQKSREELQKERDALRQEGLRLRGELDQKIMATYNKYGLRDKAKAYQMQHYEIAKQISSSIGPEGALQYLQSGPDQDLFEGATIASEGKYKIVQLLDGSVIRNNEKTGDFELIKGANPSKIATKLEEIFVGNDMKQSVIMQTDEAGNVSMKQVGAPTRFRKDRDGGSASERAEARASRKEALSENKAYWDDIAKTMRATIENVDASDVDKKKAQSVLKKLPAYRKLDSEAIRLDREPRNAQNVQDFLSGVPSARNSQDDSEMPAGVRTLGGDKQAASAGPGEAPPGYEWREKDGNSSVKAEPQKKGYAKPDRVHMPPQDRARDELARKLGVAASAAGNKVSNWSKKRAAANQYNKDMAAAGNDGKKQAEAYRKYQSALANL